MEEGMRNSRQGKWVLQQGFGGDFWGFGQRIMIGRGENGTVGVRLGIMQGRRWNGRVRGRGASGPAARNLPEFHTRTTVGVVCSGVFLCRCRIFPCFATSYVCVYGLCVFLGCFSWYFCGMGGVLGTLFRDVAGVFLVLV